MMKNIVIFDEYQELDLKPKELLEKYLQMTEDDVRNFFSKENQLKEYSSPGSDQSE